MRSRATPAITTEVRILIVSPAWVGDAVMAQPLFKRLRERHDNLVLDVLSPGWCAPLFSRMREVDSVLANPFAHGELKIGRRYRLGSELRERHYDQAIVLPNSLKSALVPFFAAIPLRTGYIGEMRKGLLNDARVLQKSRYPLMVERFALLAEKKNSPLRRPLQYPSLSSSDEQRSAILEKLGLSTKKPVAVFCPGAEYGPAKRWPAEYFAKLSRMLAGRFDIWLIGGQKDHATGEQIRLASDDACINLCGKSALDEAVDLVSCAAFVVSNDSGLMHVAAALEKPMIAIYGSSSPGFTPPLSDRAKIAKLDLPCSPCFERNCPLGHFDCMMKLTPEAVFEKIPELQA
ncbi:MAG: lipopolysaccharide heptosyltransferase II [Burkholderiales bacterium]|nr:lipopolysaccharide heptosyltransferase II [Burkholderiales bacterium]